jgi:alpha-mannosidase
VAACDSVEIVSAGPALGEIVTRGRLLDLEGKKLAGFVQRFQLPRGSRVLSIDIDLDIEQLPRADAWNSYYAARFAWSDEEAELWRSVSQTNQPTDAKRLEAPQWIEIRGDKHSTAILTGGLPYHRGIGLRKLDTLLVVRGERARKFKLGVGLDLPHPWQQAVDLLDPPLVVPRVPAPPAAARNGWLFNVDAKNVTATHWEPLREEGKVVGFRVRLLETEGRPGRVQLRAFREVRSARQIDFDGNTIVEFSVSGDTIPIDLSAYEWVEVEARW